MKLPHWLRHRWSEWQEYSTPFLTLGSYDIRFCTVCGRRQKRYV